MNIAYRRGVPKKAFPEVCFDLDVRRKVHPLVLEGRTGNLTRSFGAGGALCHEGSELGIVRVAVAGD